MRVGVSWAWHTIHTHTGNKIVLLHRRRAVHRAGEGLRIHTRTGQSVWLHTVGENAPNRSFVEYTPSSRRRPRWNQSCWLAIVRHVSQQAASKGRNLYKKKTLLGDLGSTYSISFILYTRINGLPLKGLLHSKYILKSINGVGRAPLSHIRIRTWALTKRYEFVYIR